MGLVEVVWKVVTVILNCRFAAYIDFHDVLHGFREGHEMGTASLEDKLLQKLADMAEEVLYAVFLGLYKARNALGRYRCLDILEGCVM